MAAPDRASHMGSGMEISVPQEFQGYFLSFLPGRRCLQDQTFPLPGELQPASALVGSGSDSQPAFLLHSVEIPADCRWLHSQDLPDLFCTCRIADARNGNEQVQLIDGDSMRPQNAVVNRRDHAADEAQPKSHAFTRHLFANGL